GGDGQRDGTRDIVRPAQGRGEDGLRWWTDDAAYRVHERHRSLLIRERVGARAPGVLVRVADRAVEPAPEPTLEEQVDAPGVPEVGIGDPGQRGPPLTHRIDDHFAA